MTWWGALGLALALYGVVALLEWAYDRIVRIHAVALTPVSLVLRVTNQEAHVEHVLRDVGHVFGERHWGNRAFEVLVQDSGSNDKTADIVERLRGHQPYLREALSGTTDTEVLTQCRYPIVVWVDLTRPDGMPRTLGWLTQFLTELGRG